MFIRWKRPIYLRFLWKNRLQLSAWLSSQAQEGPEGMPRAIEQSQTCPILLMYLTPLQVHPLELV